MVHCWDDYLWKVHKAVPVDPWTTNLQLLDVFIHERTSPTWLPAWLHKQNTQMARVGSMRNLGIMKDSPTQKVIANTDKGTAFSQSINRNGTSAGLQASENNVNGSDINNAAQAPPKVNGANSNTAHLAQPGNNSIDGGAPSHPQDILQNANSDATSQSPALPNDSAVNSDIARSAQPINDGIGDLLRNPNNPSGDAARLTNPISSKGIPAHPQDVRENSDSSEVSIYSRLHIKDNSMPDIQASIRTSTSLLASFTGGSSVAAQFDVKGSKNVSCNVGGVTSQQVDIDTLMELVTPSTSSGLPALWCPDISLPKLKWSSKRGQTLWVVTEIMSANKIKIEADNQAQVDAKANVSQVEGINVSNQASFEKDGLWSVIASQANPKFPFALRLLKLDYDACGNLVNTNNKEPLHRNNSVNNNLKRLSSKRMNELYRSSSVSHILP